MKKKIPKISVIIPTYNSYDTLTDSLRALKCQRFHDFEVIVINSSQENRTRQIVAETFPEALFIQSPVRLLPHSARNMGVNKARGELFAFSDPDCLTRQDWLENIWAAYQAGHQVIVGGMGVQAKTRLEMGIHICKFFNYLPGLPADSKWIAPTANAVYTRVVFKAAGPFLGKCYTGDAIQSWKAAEMGNPVWFVPEACVDHIHTQSLAGFLLERYTRGQDFARERIVYEKWNLFRILYTILSFPWLPWLVLIRAWRSTGKSGWAYHFWTTLPIQLTGHTFWSLGETVTHFRYLFRNRIE